jgi:hypothetical protein
MIFSYKCVQNDHIREFAVGGACSTNESVYKLLIGKPEGKRPKTMFVRLEEGMDCSG